MTTAKDYLESALALLDRAMLAAHPFDNLPMRLACDNAKGEIRAAACVIGIALEHGRISKAESDGAAK